MSKNILIEAAVFTPTSAINAIDGGADRIELCSGYSEGGLSPSAGTVMHLREKISKPIHVMIRPRVGDFLYGNDELRAIEKEINFCKDVGIDGIVIGLLTEARTVDIDNLQRMISVARPMSVTFHRAFDICADLYQALDDLMLCGVDRVLTSGGRSTAMEGKEVIGKLVRQADSKMKILAGGGISEANVLHLLESSGVEEVHLSGKDLMTSKMTKEKVDIKLTDEGKVSDFTWYECSPQKIRKVSALVSGR